MPATRRRREVDAPLEEVWRTVGDPHHLPRWWPRVARVEGVSRRDFTEVLRTPRGREVRADFRVTEEEQGRRRVWSQQLTGSPFEKYFTSVVVELRLAPQGDETTVTLEQRQRLRGISRFGGFLARRAARRTLRDALAALEEAVH